MKQFYVHIKNKSALSCYGCQILDIKIETPTRVKYYLRWGKNEAGVKREDFWMTRVMVIHDRCMGSKNDD